MAYREVRGASPSCTVLFIHPTEMTKRPTSSAFTIWFLRYRMLHRSMMDLIMNGQGLFEYIVKFRDVNTSRSYLDLDLLYDLLPPPPPHASCMCGRKSYNLRGENLFNEANWFFSRNTCIPVLNWCGNWLSIPICSSFLDRQSECLDPMQNDAFGR